MNKDFQAGRASMLEELRSGGVEIPMLMQGAAFGCDAVCYADEVLHYGDRRAAAERERFELVGHQYQYEDRRWNIRAVYAIRGATP